MSQSPEKTVRAAVIGLGLWGQCHVETLAALNGVEVAAVCDANAARLEEVGTRYNVANRYTTTEQLWNDDTVDLVIVATPENRHRDPVVNALHSGKHVLVEKAVATNREDVYAMRDAARETGRFLVPGHILRFDPRYAEVKRQLDLNAIGDIISIYSKRTRPNSQLAHHDENHIAFVLLPHDLDLALWWSGQRVKRVRAHERYLRPELRVSPKTDRPDFLWTQLEFENGIIANLQSTFLNPEAARVDMGDCAEVIGETGLLQAQTYDGGFSLWSNRADNAGRHSPDIGIHHHLGGRVIGALREQLSYLCDCIRKDEKPAYVSFDDAVHGVEVSTAAVQSATAGQDVLIESS